jgi:hypothetical protein
VQPRVDALADDALTLSDLPEATVTGPIGSRDVVVAIKPLGNGAFQN